MSYSVEKPVQLGLCCMNVTLKKQKVPVYAARRIIVRTIDKMGIEELKRRILQNLKDLLVMLKWNEKNGIRVFRLSSEMFQHKTNPRVPDYDYDFAVPLLKQIGAYAREKKHRLTFHPGQFNNLGSPNPKVVKQTFKDLEYHADVLDLMGMGKDSVMVIHGGGVYGDKKGAIKRWISNYHKLPDKVKKRLVLENCEKSYSVLDCLKISWKCWDAGDYGPPVVFDTHHHACYIKLHPNEKIREAEFYIEEILDTWKDRGIKPKFHVSEQGSGKIGHHSDYIEILPEYLLEIPNKFDTHTDIMIEAKAKELSIQKLYEKYPQCNCLKDNPYSICKDIMEGIVDTLVESTVVNPDLHACVVIQKHIRGYLCRKPVITVVRGKGLIDLNKLRGFMKDEFDGIRGDMAREEEANLKIESDISEYMISKCIDMGKRVGKGSGPIDVENDDIGIDVACLCLDGNTTNEKSLGQKFKGDGGNLLDIHFSNQKHTLALYLFVNELKNKLSKITKDIYYFILISTKTDIYLSILSINPKKLRFIKSKGFSSQRKSIKTSGFIHSKYGNVVLYKSKKRLELRLNRSVLEKSHHLFTLDRPPFPQ